jgi:hypothetical protein
MIRINRAYVKRLENLILLLDAALSDTDAGRATANLERDMPVLRKEADAIRACRAARERVRSNQKSKSNNCRAE